MTRGHLQRISLNIFMQGLKPSTNCLGTDQIRIPQKVLDGSHYQINVKRNYQLNVKRK